ncbi:MAG: hypothetical protein H6550_16155 [Chitinophagales bacterium]|nr:hypothetical protein [Chitinophagales bacterium]
MYSDRFLSGMFHTYCPCRVRVAHYDYDLLATSVYAHRVNTWPFEDVKLRLTPLYDISGEHVLLLASVLHKHLLDKYRTGGHEPVLTIASRFGNNKFVIDVHIPMTNSTDVIPLTPIKLRVDDTVKESPVAVRLLQQLGYDCGYSGFDSPDPMNLRDTKFITVPSLIEAGLAVKA